MALTYSVSVFAFVSAMPSSVLALAFETSSVDDSIALSSCYAVVPVVPVVFAVAFVVLVFGSEHWRTDAHVDVDADVGVVM